MTTSVPPRRRPVVGAVSAGVALGVVTFVDGMWPAAPSLVLAIGQAVIRWSPGSVARGGVETFGTADKPLLVLGTVVLSLLFGAWASSASARRPWVLPAAMVAFGCVGAFAAVRVLDAGVVPSVVTAAVGVLAGVGTHRLLLAAARPRPAAFHPIGSAVDRRRFLGAAAGAAGGAALLGAMGADFRRRSVADAQRASVVLPRPTSPAPPPEGVTVADGAVPWVTPNRDFYRIDEALLIPSVDVDTWRLRVTGMVDTPLELSYDDLLGRPLVERFVTLACVSNEVGGDLVGNAKWLGYPLAALLDEAGVRDGADQVVGRSVDGFTTGFPVADAVDGRDALVAVGMNGEPLPTRHGFPARLVVPGLYGYVSATKWLGEIELTTFDAYDPYWIERGWARLGPVRTQSRIDVPRAGASVAAGTVVVAGVAWAQHRGITGVEVAVDDGAWRRADLGDDVSIDTWRQWRFEWDAEPGRHTLAVRATDASGDTQTAERRPVFPDGATGHHRVTVVVD